MSHRSTVKASSSRGVLGDDKGSSKTFIGWIRQSSIKRSRSREVTQAQCSRQLDDDGTCKLHEELAEVPNASTKDTSSLAEMFNSVPRRAEPKDGLGGNAEDGAGVRRTQTAHSLSVAHARSEHIDERMHNERTRSVHSDPGDLSDSSGHALRHAPRDEPPQATPSKENSTESVKIKKVSSYSGLGRLGSFLTKSFSRSRSRNRHTKDVAAPSQEVEPQQDACAPLPNTPSAPDSPAPPKAAVLPDFSAQSWIDTFEQEGDSAVATSKVMATCGRALDGVTVHLRELEGNILRLIEAKGTEPQRKGKSPEAARTAETEQGVAGALARARRQMDNADEFIFGEIEHQEEHIVLAELLQIVGLVKGIISGVKYASRLDTAAQHDVQGEEDQLEAWQRKRGALRENTNCLKALYRRVCGTRDKILLSYHEECIRLNQTIQLLIDRITETVTSVFAEFERPPSLDFLYGRPNCGKSTPKYMDAGNELDYKSNTGSVASHQRVFGHLPAFIARLKLYAFNSVGSVEPYNGDQELKGDSRASARYSVGPSAQLFTPVSLEQCLPRQSCIKTVPPGLALMASEAEIQRYEAQIWTRNQSGGPLEGGWGSFRVFEQWLVDAMKWQWRDAFMYSKLQERRSSLQEMIKEKKQDIQEAVCLRLKQLWWGRLVEMQAFYIAGAEASFMRDLRRAECLYGATLGAQDVEDEDEGLPNVAFNRLFMTNGKEIENALMCAEDARSSVLRIVKNPAYKHFKDSLEVLNSRPSDAAAYTQYLKQQIERAGSLIRRFDDATESVDGYETLEKECTQLEAALAILQQEANSLESKLSSRQSQLSAKRQKLTHNLEKLSAVFDVDNQKLSATEAQWDSAEKLEQLVHELMPTAEEVAAYKDKLAQEKIQLEAEKAEIQRERERLSELEQELAKTEQAREAKPTSGLSGLDIKPSSHAPAENAVFSAPQSAKQDMNQLLSTAQSKSFVGRLFGASSRASTPRQSKANAHKARSDAPEELKTALTATQSAADMVPNSLGSDEKLLLRHGQSAPVHLESLLELNREKSRPLESLPGKKQEQTQHDLPLTHALSSPSVLMDKKEEQWPPTSHAVILSATSSKEEQQQATRSQTGRTESFEILANDADMPKRRKSKGTPGLSLTRKSHKRKKSMYSKLRSAFSLSHKSKNGSTESVGSPKGEPPKGLEGRLAAHRSFDTGVAEPSKEEGEPVQSHEGIQSAELATIPNIFDSDGDSGAGDGLAPLDSAGGAIPLSVGDSNRYEGSNVAAADGTPSQEPAAASLEGFSRGTTITFMGAAKGQATANVSLAESFRRASPDLKERPQQELQGRRSPSDSLPNNVKPSFPSDSAVEEEHLPEFGSYNVQHMEYEESDKDVKSRPLSPSIKNMQGPTEETTQTEVGPLVPFPSLSAGSPSDFQRGVKDQIVPVDGIQARLAQEIPSRRRRSDITGSPRHPATISLVRGTQSSRAVAFDTSIAGFSIQSSSGCVDEDDRIELFLCNSQPDLTTAVMGSPVFSLLNAEERQHCIHLMLNSFVQIPRGCMLIQKGEKVDTLYFLVSGELGMTEANATEPQENTSALAPPSYSARRRSSYDMEISPDKVPIKIGPGAFVTPRAFVREEQTNHSVVALRPCTLQKLSFHSFQQVISSCIFRRASQVMSYLGHCPILESLTRSERVQIAALLKWKIYLPDEVLCSQGQLCSGLLLVVHGYARAFLSVERQGSPEMVDELGPGDNVNALALLHDAPSDVTVIAAAPDGCVVAVLERRELKECLGNVESILKRRLENTSESQRGRASGLNQLKKQLSNFWTRRGSH